ncbi:Crp/Fnr family transcriptional regulator [Actinomadura graeca]|uniref:Crp/Fnr family transcriptional regulator n=1 Tax=Actinomadura graeca TaxID=2750812 RepID=A0ABX8QQ31_9ACTN|nr:Crp/Fnr family transcriptional regulator [Actinomadura graeca]QXJ20730.1 Crp/Fnr family transcriptional regulator [Actinomadura graeca]
MTDLKSLLPENGWARLAGTGTAKTFSPREILLRQGYVDDHLILLLHGRVKVTWLGADGNEIVLAIRGSGDLIGEIALLSGQGHSANVSAIDRCATRLISSGEFNDAIRELDCEKAVMHHALSRLHENEIFRAELPTLPAEQRVLRTLLRLAVSPAARRRADPVEVPLDQAEFGRTVGLSRGHVSTDLGKLRSLGLIETCRGRILIHDMDALRRMSSGNPADSPSPVSDP